MRKLLFPFALVLLTTACGGGGGTTQDNLASNDIGNQTSNINEPSVNVIDTTGFVGYYSIVATPSSVDVGIANLYCISAVGQFAVYDDKLSGWASGYGINANVNNLGSINGNYTIGSTTAGTFLGSLNSQTGSGTYADTGSPCKGTWTATKISYATTTNNAIFTLTPNNYPAALKFKFSPTNISSNSAVACETSVGIINTNGQVSTGTAGVTYNGYAQSSQGYRTDVQLKLNPDSGAVEGSFEYDPLGIIGSFTGDLYFGNTARTYSNRSSSSNAGCNGTWSVTTIDREFPNPPLTENTSDDTGNTSSPTPTLSDYSKTIPYCQEASDRILAAVLPDMTPEQVLRAVGKPFRISGSYGQNWYYTRNSTPSVDFKHTATGPTKVEGYNGNDTYCSQTTDNNLIAAANNLAAEENTTDYASEIPTCLDASTRILAWVSPGMAPESIFQTVGKPLQISGSYGQNWYYTTSSNPYIDFYHTAEGPTAVKGYSVSTSTNCQ